MRLMGRLLLLVVLLAGSSAFALGFDGRLGLEGEAEYADRLDARVTWGVRAIPLSDPLILIVPGGFAVYRETPLEEGATVLSAYGKAKAGIGWLPQFPQFFLGLEARL